MGVDRRGILDRRDPVIQQVVGEVQAVVVAGLLAQRLAHAHPDRALDLAFDRQPVQRLAAIVRDPDIVHRHFAGGLVDRHFHGLGGVGEAHRAADRGAAVFLAAPAFRDRVVDALGGDRAGIAQGLHHDLLERDAGVLAAGAVIFAQHLDVFRIGFQLARRGFDQDLAQIGRRFEGRVADIEGDAGRIGAIVLRRHLAVRGDHPDAVDRQAEHIGGDLGDEGRRALADLGRAGEHGDRAVPVQLQVDGRMRLAGPVHRLRGAGDIVGGGETDALLLAGSGSGRPSARFSFQPLACSTQSMHSGRP